MAGWAVLAGSVLSLESVQSFLGSVFGIVVLLKCPLSFNLHQSGGWQQISLKNVSVHFSPLSS